MEPCCPPMPEKNWMQENSMTLLIGAAVVLFILYFIIKTGVKNGILELLNDPACPLIGGQNCCR